MLRFIICDDNKEFRHKVKQIIENYLMNYDLNYQIELFSEYDKKFREATKKDGGLKIYFLDIETPTGSGIDAIRRIREEVDDWAALILLITAHNEYKYEALGSRLYIMDFIVKFDDFEAKIIKALKVILSKYHQKGDKLIYQYNSYFNIIDFSDIIYIEKEPDSKRSIIYTTYGKERIPKTLSEIIKLLDKRFFRTHRSVIINTDQIKKIDYQNNKILFKNNQYTDLIARNKKKELMNYVRNNN